ncbi:putative ATP-dependent endonuclease of the OLD family [Variovorax sp. PDC80]|uniref:ATP-dependent nuclease n=1 Tax=Variovorax sp. PDC80 TaxID=1882827 RepID=UPI0008E01894|nr:AAA family ATPase [Variovorax sp. PDC80]SFN99621.1 putative ATP-dependent endonuclease of the OLD family [Variovorax sp. PDC80]
MHVESVTLTNFRCFGGAPTKVALDAELTTIVGPNGAGKTALLQALMRLFGVTRAQRTIVLADFHVPPPGGAKGTEAPGDTRTLSLDVVVRLPELADGSATAATVAPVFRRIHISAPGAVPACRLRLEARWDDDGTAEGTVTQELFWVNSLEDDFEESQKSGVAAAERGLIQLYYTPANRDAQSQIKATTGALAARLLKAIEWSQDTEDAVDTASKTLTDAFGGEDAIKAIGKALSKRWSYLHDGDIDTQPGLSLMSRRFEEVVARIGVVFKQGPAGEDRGLEALSDGQQSLFYFALAAAVFDLERDVIAGDVEGFRDDALSIPALTLFAIEEPENHLSPYYLARIIQQISSMVKGGAGQALISSHSPSVLSRVPPERVRYCRRDAESATSSVLAIPMPKDGTEAVKFVRSAMLAYPELYFARFVLLVEGDSERIVLPKLAEAQGLLLDPSFVAIAPLGGRHVQHFWRLLTGLGIPFATLLDLDLGREGGGYGRVKTSIQQLLANGANKRPLLELKDGLLSDKSLEGMHDWETKIPALRLWLDDLEKYNVFFSWPLDLDLAMLQAFPDAYKATIEGSGPRMKNEDAAVVVLGAGGKGLEVYTDDAEPFAKHMAAYRYHFLTNSKPATHLRALTHVSSATLKKDMPECLLKVLQHIKDHLPAQTL